MLRERFETSVVPGDFFEQPQHFRVGFGGATEAVRGGLERIETALEAFGKTSAGENSPLLRKNSLHFE